MRSRFSNIIDEVIKEEIEQSGLYSQAKEILRQLQDTRQIIADLETRISHLTEQLISTLSGEIRKRQPKLDIGLKKGKCHAGYKSKDIIVRPDFDNGKWDIGGSLGGRFVKDYPHLSQLTDDISPLADAISDYFNSRYKTLNI